MMMMTPQEIFDTASIAVLKQGQRATRNELCVYRAANGLKCALGHLIPDEMYKKEMEGNGAYTVVKKFPELPEYLRTNIELVKHLQNAHDMSDGYIATNEVFNDPTASYEMSREGFRHNFITSIHNIAEYHGLSTAKFDEVVAQTHKKELS